MLSLRSPPPSRAPKHAARIPGKYPCEGGSVSTGSIERTGGGTDRGCPIRFAPVATSKPTRVGKPWGHELWWAETDHYAGKIIVVNVGQALSLQYHREKDETSYLLSGKLRLTQGERRDAQRGGDRAGSGLAKRAGHRALDRGPRGLGGAGGLNAPPRRRRADA